MTTTPKKGSQYLKRSKSTAGVAEPCKSAAACMCPICKRALCPGHSRRLTTMGGKNRLGHHRCSGCGYVGDISKFAFLTVVGGR